MGTLVASGATTMLQIDDPSVTLDGVARATDAGQLLLASNSSGISGDGEVEIDHGGIATIDSAEVSGITVRFNDGFSNHLAFETDTTFNGTIEDLQGSDVISFGFVAADEASWSDGVLTLSENGTVATSFRLTSDSINYADASFQATTQSNIDVTFSRPSLLCPASPLAP